MSITTNPGENMDSLTESEIAALVVFLAANRAGPSFGATQDKLRAQLALLRAERVKGYLSPTKLKVGMVVQTKVVVVDEDDRGSLYLHAVPGDFGVIMDCDAPDTFPVIAWTNSGVCNMDPKDLEMYTGRVCYVCGDPSECDS